MAGALNRGDGASRLRELGEELERRRPHQDIRSPRPGNGCPRRGLRAAHPPDGTAEVSYWTHAGKRGRGHARNALALLLGYAASIGVTRLEAHVATGNHALRRVAESAGFTHAGTFTDDGTEMTRYTRDVPRPCGTPS